MNLLDFSLDDGPETGQQPLFGGLMLKAIDQGADKPWKFAGIASDEDSDVEGDSILRKSIDLTYAKQRGYVNWDHSRAPEYQIGFLTKAEIVPPTQVKELKKAFPQIGENASVYVEGELYKEMPQAVHVYNIMKSTPEGGMGLGLSLDGSIARDTRNNGIVRAFVRGVALTAAPVQPKTLLKLRKSLAAYNEIQGLGGLPSDLAGEIARQVVEQIATIQQATLAKSFSREQAVQYVMQQRPAWNRELAEKVVSFTLAKKVNRS